MFLQCYIFYSGINPNEGVRQSLGEDVTEIRVNEVFLSHIFPTTGSVSGVINPGDRQDRYSLLVGLWWPVHVLE